MMLDSPHTLATILIRGGHPSAVSFPPHQSRQAGYPSNLQPATVSDQELVRSLSSEARCRGGRLRELPPSTARHRQCGTVMQSCTSTSPPHVPVPRISSQCTFLQMIYTAGNQHTNCYGHHPEDAHALSRPAAETTHDTHCANNNRMSGRQMSCRQQTAPTQLDATYVILWVCVFHCKHSNGSCSGSQPGCQLFH